MKQFVMHMQQLGSVATMYETFKIASAMLVYQSSWLEGEGLFRHGELRNDVGMGVSRFKMVRLLKSVHVQFNKTA